jgi:hypothetical protein
VIGASIGSITLTSSGEGTQRGIYHLPGEAARSWPAFDLTMATNVSK